VLLLAHVASGYAHSSPLASKAQSHPRCVTVFTVGSTKYVFENCGCDPWAERSGAAVLVALAAETASDITKYYAD